MLGTIDFVSVTAVYIISEAAAKTKIMPAGSTHPLFETAMLSLSRRVTISSI
jgi:hypothetical protein